MNKVQRSLFRQKLQGLANDGWNLIYMMSFFVMLFGVIFRFIVSNLSVSNISVVNEPIARRVFFQAYTFADADLKKAYYGSDSTFISEVEKCPPMIVGAQDSFYLSYLSTNQS